MANTRLSFKEWLQAVHGVVSINENTDVIAYRNKAVINYLFNNADEATQFANTFEINVVYFNDQIAHIDSFSGKYAVIVNIQKYNELQKSYQAYLKYHTPRSTNIIRKQLKSINKMTIFLKKNPKAAKELRRLKQLARNKHKKEISSRATRYFCLALKNYLILNYDTCNTHELEALLHYQQLLEGKKSDGIILQDTYFLRSTLIKQDYQAKQTKPFIIADAFTLLNGGEKPVIVYEHGCFKKSNAMRTIPRFLPSLKHPHSEAIYLDAGGEVHHRTIVKIWKSGVDSHENIIKNSEKPHHFQFYHTEYNAGSGSKWASNPQQITGTDQNTTGILWAVSTRPILINWRYKKRKDHTTCLRGETLPDNQLPQPGTQSYSRLVHDTLMDVIITERMLTHYTPDALDTEKKTNCTHVVDLEKWNKWHKRREAHLGERIDHLSEKNIPQRSGNCSVFSLITMAKSLLGSRREDLPAESFHAEDLWFQCKLHDNNTIHHALQKKEKELTKELKRATHHEAKKPLHISLSNSNMTLSIFNNRPSLKKRKHNELYETTRYKP